MVGSPGLVCGCSKGANNYRPHWNPECPFYVSPLETEIKRLRSHLDDCCAEVILRNTENAKLREALITIADRLEDAGCQCDSSDEYVYKCNLCVANDALLPTGRNTKGSGNT